MINTPAELSFSEREFFIYRIISGYLDIEELKVYHPLPNVLLQANKIYLEYNHKCELDNALTDGETLWLLREHGLWDDNKSKEFDILPEHIEKFKVELFGVAFEKEKQKQIKTYLNFAKKKYEELFNIRHSFDHLSISGISNFAKWLFIITNCTYLNNKLYNWENHNILDILNQYHIDSIHDDNMRHISRTEPWSSYYNANTKNGKIFKYPLTQEQERLINWTGMYESIKESPECPAEQIIADNDMLDGWIIIQRKKRQADKDRILLEEKIGNKKGDEIFLFADNIEDAKRIDSLNNIEAQITKERRFNLLKKKGSLQAHELPDAKDKIRQEIMERQRNG